jgi:hypothetical protein
LEDAPRDPHGALIRTEHYAELDGLTVRIPTSVLGEGEKHCDLQGDEGYVP